MKFTLNWLKEYLDTNATIEEICDKLNEIGLEVEDVIDNGKELIGFNCVEIIECENHPNSDHLHICKIKTIDNNILQIVCGAPNARKGLKTILAPVGIKMPFSDIVITKTKIRGVESNGMLCSEKELGISDNHVGIIELDSSTEIGKSIIEIKKINDVIIDINITPNRGDCLGIYGIARDLSAVNLGILKPFENYKPKEQFESPIKCEIKNNNCINFSCRYIKNVKNCESPDWLKEKLQSIGINPKMALVDITNYVMFILNKPMHCYDADCIKGDIVIDRSNGSEKFLALNKEEYLLPSDAILINDTSGNILGLGGIIGGENSSISINTNNILLECASFDPITIATTARKLSINTDAKYRFERGVDFTSNELALNYATYLINTICGGENSEMVFSQSTTFTNRELEFNLDSIRELLGIQLDKTKVINILDKLGYKVKNTNNSSIIQLTIPSWRNDILIKENVIEDIIRIYGYDNLSEIEIDNIKFDENLLNEVLQDKMWKISSCLSSRGMLEVISWSFMDEEKAKEFANINENLKISNPIIKDFSYMRPSIIPNLMTIAKYNQNRYINDISIFEKGKIFINQTPEGQKNMISGIRIGLNAIKDIFNSSREFDIYDVKKDIYDVLKILDISPSSLKVDREGIPDYYHPTRSGAIKIGNICVGFFGEIHPMKVKKFDLKNKVNAFELFLDNLPKVKINKITQKKKFVLNDFQPIYRDFAFIIKKDIEVGNIINVIKNTNKELIKDIHIFDIYQGQNIEEDKKSIAFEIKIQPLNKTLTGEEINTISNKIIEEIEKQFNGILRDK